MVSCVGFTQGRFTPLGPLYKTPETKLHNDWSVEGFRSEGIQEIA